MRNWLKYILSTLTILFTVNVAIAGPFTDKNKLGDLFMVMAPAYALGMTIANEDYKGTLQLAETITVAQLASEGIKALNLEERPNHSDKKSFPSGHAAGAFSAATFVHKRYGWKPALLPYGMSIIASWSRVAANAHYWHDCLAGAGLSALITWFLVDEYIPANISINTDIQTTIISFKTQF